MLNSVILVGRLTKDPTVVETENKTKRTILTLAIPREFKNQDGTYDTDFINCTLWNTVAEHTCEYCRKGDIVGIRGRIQTSSYVKDEETKYRIDIMVSKVSFLMNKPKESIKEETS